MNKALRGVAAFMLAGIISLPLFLLANHYAGGLISFFLFMFVLVPKSIMIARHVTGYDILVEAGFPPAEALAYILTFGDFVTGCALEHQAENERRRLRPVDHSTDMLKRFEPYPMLYAASTSRRGGPGTGGPSGSFERGLALLMTGLRLRHAELIAEKHRAAE